MTDESHSELHPDVLIAVKRLYPACSKFPTVTWNRIAAFAGDDYRSDIDEPEYKELLHLKIKYAVDGYSTRLARTVDELQFPLGKNILDMSWDSGLRDKAALFFVLQEVESFSAQIEVLSELPELERLMLRTESEECGRDLLQASPKARSKAIYNMLHNDLISWEGLPNALMRFITKQFADRLRVDPFWESIQREVGPYFDRHLLKTPEYKELLSLQVRHHGFHDDPQELTQLAEELSQRLGQSDASQKTDNSLILRQLSDLLQSIHPPPSRGRD